MLSVLLLAIVLSVLLLLAIVLSVLLLAIVLSVLLLAIVLSVLLLLAIVFSVFLLLAIVLFVLLLAIVLSVLLLLAIVLSVLLRFTASDCPFGIFKLFLLIWNKWDILVFKYCDILALIVLWWRILGMLIKSKTLLANKSFPNELFSSVSLFNPTAFKIML